MVSNFWYTLVMYCIDDNDYRMTDLSSLQYRFRKNGPEKCTKTTFLPSIAQKFHESTLVALIR